MKNVTPDERLRAAADFVRQGAVFADIGTDHAYLPVFLCREGKISRAYACDIVEGPLARAKEHIGESGFADRITPVLTDGLVGLEACGITDVAICGMGGELIARILADAPFVKDKNIRLILQPMTHAQDLRAFLAKEGFSIVDECVRSAAGKHYFCIAAEYCGTPYPLSRIEKELGAVNIRRRPPEDAFLQLLLRKIRSAERRTHGLSASDACDAELLKTEKEYLNELYALADELGCRKERP